ncbi:MerR family transcriptional regulator, partial [Bacillus atrophaeus ATCC 9372]
YKRKIEEEQAEEKIGSAHKRKRKEVQEKIKAYENTIKKMNNDIMSEEKGKQMMSWIDDIEVVISETQTINILNIRQMMRSDDY